MLARRGPDQLDIDMHRVARLLHTPFQDVRHPELLRNFGKVPRAARVARSRDARYYLERSYLCQLGQNFVLYALREVGIRFLVAQIRKGENRDGFFVHSERRLWLGFSHKQCDGRENRSEKNQPDDDCRPTRVSSSLPESPEFAGKGRIADVIPEEIREPDAHAVFYFALTQVLQVRLPISVLLQVFGYPLRKQDMTSIAAIHHSLRNINPRAGDVGLVVDVRDL